MTVAELVVAWRARAAELKPYAPAAAQAFETASLELEQALRTAAAEALNLRQAARESGYSEDHLGELLRQGKIPNAGRPHAPRILRSELPRKPGGGKRKDVTSLAAVTREALASRARR